MSGLEPFFLALAKYVYGCAKIFTVTIFTELYCSITYEPKEKRYKCTLSYEKSSSADFWREVHDA